MDSILEFLANAEGLYDLGSLVKLFLLMIGSNGFIGIVYALTKGFSGR